MEKSEIAKKEEEILKFWQENKIFEKTLNKKGDDFVFYDGPPFATGLPHYGHILASVLKDAIPRYQTMRGKRVARRWGWDCHGLPIENLVEKELGLASKKDIEKFGLELFNQKARASVLRYADEWKKIIPRIGRWVDMDHDYKTMDPGYTEKVWGVFKTLYEKGLVYEGYKSMHLCPRCETTLANFEVNLGYKDITDLSVFVKFALLAEPATYLLAWTTTPWTLPGNAALAVNKKNVYSKLKVKSEFIILAKDKITEVLGDQEFEVVEEFTGEKLIGKKYKTVFDYYLKESRVCAADFVSAEEGTGIVHIAPAFGEDDMRLGETENLPFIQHVTWDGHFMPEVKDFAGLAVKPQSADEKTRLEADIAVIKYLQERGNFFAKKKITHSYPHCWRCDTPLLNYAASSWFVKVTDLKDKLLAENQKVNWVPEHIKDGRFGKWLEGARDWAVSRQRFWGAPLPVWHCEACKKVTVLGGLDDWRRLVKKSGNKYLVMRHGYGENNQNGIVSGKNNSGALLTDRGREESRVAGQKLRTEKIDLIFSSNFTRARETTELVAAELGLAKEQIIYDDRIEEIHTGEFDGKTNAEYHNFFANYGEMISKRPQGGENLSDLRRRAMEFIYELESKYQNKTILLSTHEYVAWMLWAGSLAWNDEEIIKNKPEEFLRNAEVRELAFIPLPHNRDYELDFHRPYIDELKLVCECHLPADEAGREMTRIEDVFDVWFDSASMPYSQEHFPADFIAEGLDQTRGWFYSLLVLGVGLKGKSPYRNVIVNGLILAEDGQKMSKRLNNYPDPALILDKYGADALRFYLLSSPVVQGEDFSFSERGLGEVTRRVLMRLKNVFAFYQLYASTPENHKSQITNHNLLDSWILSRLAELNLALTNALDNYKIAEVGKPLDQFVDDLSTWYLRRSRERFKSSDELTRATAISVMHEVLITLAKLMAPLMPFVAEEIYLALRAPSEAESVHLNAWPAAEKVNEEIIVEMQRARQLVSLALEERARAGIKVRQPLNELKVKHEKLKEELIQLIKDEVNVKTVVFGEKLDKEVALDLTITPELKREGDERDLWRAVQDLRKEKGLAVTARPTLIVATDEAGACFLAEARDALIAATNLAAIECRPLTSTDQTIPIGDHRLALDFSP